MLQLDLKGGKRLLFLGAHSDDIEIGCGATILKLRKAQPALEVLWVVFSAEGKRQQEGRTSARFFLGKNHRTKVVLKRFKESYFRGQSGRVKRYWRVSSHSSQRWCSLITARIGIRITGCFRT